MLEDAGVLELCGLEDGVLDDCGFDEAVLEVLEDDAAGLEAGITGLGSVYLPHGFFGSGSVGSHPLRLVSLEEIYLAAGL